MWTLCKRVLLLIVAVCAVTGCALLWLIFSATNIKPNAGGEAVSLDSLSLQLDILSLTMAAVGIALAAVGLFGYQTLREAAEARAERTAAEIAAMRADEIATAAVAKHLEGLHSDDGLARTNQAATVELGSVTEVERKED